MLPPESESFKKESSPAVVTTSQGGMSNGNRSRIGPGTPSHLSWTGKGTTLSLAETVYP